MTVNEMINRIEFINETVRDLNKLEGDTDMMNTIQDAIGIIEDYQDELLRKKIAP